MRFRTPFIGIDVDNHGTQPVVIDQPASIGALPVTAAHADSITIAYLPELAMRRVVDIHQGEA